MRLRRDADAVQTAGDFVSAAAELATRANDGHDDIQRFHRLSIGIFFRWMRTNRNTASVIFNGHAAIFMNCDIDGSAAPASASSIALSTTS